MGGSSLVDILAVVFCVCAAARRRPSPSPWRFPYFAALLCSWQSLLIDLCMISFVFGHQPLRPRSLRVNCLLFVEFASSPVFCLALINGDDGVANAIMKGTRCGGLCHHYDGEALCLIHCLFCRRRQQTIRLSPTSVLSTRTIIVMHMVFIRATDVIIILSSNTVWTPTGICRVASTMSSRYRTFFISIILSPNLILILLGSCEELMSHNDLADTVATHTRCGLDLNAAATPCCCCARDVTNIN